MKFIPYLVFAGKAEKAMNYYKEALGGQITQIERFGSMKDANTPEAIKDYVLHGEVKVGELVIYFSDSPRPVAQGDNVTLLVDFPTEAEIDRCYKALSVESTIDVPLGATFWGAKYANLKDKFGVTWQLNFQYPK
ncbi:MAG TPA: VOC family protein [Rectinemataceae bacterium]|nr:VOC family protein [Rectinemataceae bacterium]